MIRAASTHSAAVLIALALAAAAGCSADPEERAASEHAIIQATPTVAPFTETPIRPGEVHDYLFNVPPKELARVFTSGDATRTFTAEYEGKQLGGAIGSRIVFFNSSDQPKTYALRFETNGDLVVLHSTAVPECTLGQACTVVDACTPYERATEQAGTCEQHDFEGVVYDDASTSSRDTYCAPRC